MVFTVTSHHPYPIPKQYKNQFKSAKGENPLLKCIRYTDYSLRRFFETASKEEWYKHTLFIILGDHPGYLLSKPYAKLDGMYRIPFIVYDPSTELSERSERIVQQPDVMPTVLDYLGYGDKCICFGKSLFRTGNEGFQVAYGNGYYILNRTGKEPTVLCGEHERGDEDGQKFLKAYLHQYRKVLRARIDKTEE